MKWLIKHPYWFALIVVGLIAGLSLLLVFFFTRVAFLHDFDLSNSASLGTAIGGLTAPVIGISSCVLLFFALIFQISSVKVQTESTSNQAHKTEIDILVELQRQFLVEITTFSYSVNMSQGDRKWTESYTGIRALSRLVSDVNNVQQFRFKLGNFPEAKQIFQIIDSYVMFEEEIVKSSLPAKWKSIFNAKLNSSYTNYLKKSLRILDNGYESHPDTQDDCSNKLHEFLKKTG